MGITCSPLCISSIAVTAAPSTNCIYDQDKGFCALIAATNIGSLTNYGAWSCTTNGITSTSPCNWIGLNCYPGINVFAVYLPMIHSPCWNNPFCDRLFDIFNISEFRHK